MEAGSESLSGFYQYSRRNLFFAAIVAAYLFIGVGLFMGWASPAMILLEDQNFTTSEKTMIVSLPGLAPGPLITMFALDLIGRKWSLFLIWSTFMICWVMINITVEVTALMIARFIGGWGMGAAFSAVGIYISEISDVRVRSALNASTMVFLTTGIIIVQTSGPFVGFSLLSLICIVMTGAFAIFFWFIPESPYYHVKQGNMSKAKDSLTWLRHNAKETNIQDELAQIQYSIEEERKSKVGFRKLFSSKAVLLEFCVAWYLLYLQQASGLNVILSYMQTIFTKANLKIDPAYVPMILNSLSFISGLGSPFLIKKLGNRISAPVSTIACGLGNVVTAIYFLLQESGKDVSSISWLPIVSICFVMCIVHIGLTGVVWSVVADIFPPSVKGYANGISGIFSTLLGFVVNTIFGFSTEKYGFGITFMGFGVLMLVSSVGLFFIPEFTKMSLQEIQDYFEGKSKKEQVDRK